MSEQSQLALFCAGEKNNSKTVTNIYVKVSCEIGFSKPIYDSHKEELKKQIEKSVYDLDKEARICFDKEANNEHWASLPFFALDVETTGLDPAGNRVIEIALVPFNMPLEESGLEQLFCVEEPLSKEITAITGITDQMLLDKPKFPEKIDKIISLFQKASFIVAYNAKFDKPFVESEMARAGKILPEIQWVDPFIFICEFDRFKKGKKLSDSAQRWGVSLGNAHRAFDDAKAAGELLLKMSEKIDCQNFEELIEKQKLFQWRQAQSMAEYKKNNLWSNNR